MISEQPRKKSVTNQFSRGVGILIGESQKKNKTKVNIGRYAPYAPKIDQWTKKILDVSVRAVCVGVRKTMTKKIQTEEQMKNHFIDHTTKAKN